MNNKTQKQLAKNTEKTLKNNVLDEIQCTPRQKKIAKIGLAGGLWIPFLTAVLLLFLCSRGILGK